MVRLEILGALKPQILLWALLSVLRGGSGMTFLTLLLLLDPAEYIKTSLPVTLLSLMPVCQLQAIKALRGGSQESEGLIPET